MQIVIREPPRAFGSSAAGLDASGHVVDASCTCITEQGTAYDVAEGECRRIARRGQVYNPYHLDMQGAQGRAFAVQPDAQPTASPSRGVRSTSSPVASVSPVASYGQMRDGSPQRPLPLSSAY